jgi:hypothetical protein
MLGMVKERRETCLDGEGEERNMLGMVKERSETCLVS